MCGVDKVYKMGELHNVETVEKVEGIDKVGLEAGGPNEQEKVGKVHKVETAEKVEKNRWRRLTRSRW